MKHDPFIPQSESRARQWVDHCSAALGIPREQAAGMLANLYGFASWDVMMIAVESLPPSSPDEEVSPSLYADRVSDHMHVLVDKLEQDPKVAIQLLTRLPPTSARALAAFTLQDELSISPEQRVAFRSYVMEYFDEHLDELLEEENGDDFFRVLTEPNRAAILTELSGHTDPLGWAQVLEYLGWDFEFSGDQCPDLDEPCFTVTDADLGQVPVYLSPIGCVPTQPIDRCQRVERAACVGDFISHWAEKSSVALLLQRWPAVKHLKGHTYCHLGSVYHRDTNRWTALLFNQACTSVSRLLELNTKVSNLELGTAELTDPEGGLAHVATLVLSGVDLDDVRTGRLDPRVDLALLCAGESPADWNLHRYVAVEEVRGHR
ncbi:hypothetical protein [Pseudomonas guariconensis]|uniref:hypothetical protein n=1 Tax=Pseudomonas guariconensis TaxID=1288410 RepID=UPI0039058285